MSTFNQDRARTLLDALALFERERDSYLLALEGGGISAAPSLGAGLASAASALAPAASAFKIPTNDFEILARAIGEGSLKAILAALRDASHECGLVRAVMMDRVDQADDTTLGGVRRRMPRPRGKVGRPRGARKPDSLTERILLFARERLVGRTWTVREIHTAAVKRLHVALPHDASLDALRTAHVRLERGGDLVHVQVKGHVVRRYGLP